MTGRDSGTNGIQTQFMVTSMYICSNQLLKSAMEPILKLSRVSCSCHVIACVSEGTVCVCTCIKNHVNEYVKGASLKCDIGNKVVLLCTGPSAWVLNLIKSWHHSPPSFSACCDFCSPLESIIWWWRQIYTSGTSCNMCYRIFWRVTWCCKLYSTVKP